MPSSILERYEKLRQEHGDKVKTQEFITFLHAENARAVRLSRNATENDIEELREDCFRFYLSILEDYDESTEIWARIQKEWNGEPFILKTGREMLKQVEAELSTQNQT